MPSVQTTLYRIKYKGEENVKINQTVFFFLLKKNVKLKKNPISSGCPVLGGGEGVIESGTNSHFSCVFSWLSLVDSMFSDMITVCSKLMISGELVEIE